MGECARLAALDACRGEHHVSADGIWVRGALAELKSGMHRQAAVMTVAFDTLKLADRLEAAGMTPAQARGTASALAETMTGAVATAADIAAIRAEIRESELRLRTEIADLRSDILKWVIGAIGFQTVIVIGAVAGLIRLLR
jgi:hypothetical protein